MGKSGHLWDEFSHLRLRICHPSIRNRTSNKMHIHRFCGLKGHEMFCQVERSYIEDSFNLYGLRACVSNFSDCLDLILDRIGPEDSDDSHLTQSACTLYGLIHARYIVTTHGLDSMYNKVCWRDTSSFGGHSTLYLVPFFLNFFRNSTPQKNSGPAHWSNALVSRSYLSDCAMISGWTRPKYSAPNASAFTSLLPSELEAAIPTMAGAGPLTAPRSARRFPTCSS